jgi:hypothetical protein
MNGDFDDSAGSCRLQGVRLPVVRCVGVLS